jgi:hypothetical protein
MPSFQADRSIDLITINIAPWCAPLGDKQALFCEPFADGNLSIDSEFRVTINDSSVKDAMKQGE